ncbi:MAG: hypothetical protein MHPSP_002495, partial [Paramarteilia canceri]
VTKHPETGQKAYLRGLVEYNMSPYRLQNAKKYFREDVPKFCKRFPSHFLYAYPIMAFYFYLYKTMMGQYNEEERSTHR